MTYDMSFKGRFEFPNRPAAIAAVGSFARSECLEESIVRPEDLAIRDRAVCLDVDASAPATWWESTCDALATLSEEATDGAVEAVFEGGEGPDASYRVRILPGGDEEELERA